MREDTLRGPIEDRVRALGYDQASLRCELLQGGISGASVYTVNLPFGPIVIKLAEAASPQEVLDRAHREMHFYRDLAERIPLHVPLVLGMAPEADAPWLCLRSYQPAPPIESWTERQYREVAEQLARFHSVFWGRTEELTPRTWLRRPARSTKPDVIRQAMMYWRALSRQTRFRRALTEDTITWIEAMAECVRDLDAVFEALPTTLCHGDCHHGNLLLDVDGRWLWADWQEVGIGCGPEDLSFFFQRARFAGGSVPEDAALAAYHQGLESAIGRNIPATAIKRAVDASELQTLLLLWPPFLSHMSGHRLGDIVRRLHELAEGLEIETLIRG